MILSTIQNITKNLICAKTPTDSSFGTVSKHHLCYFSNISKITRPCLGSMITRSVTGIYRTYLSTLSHKRLSEKKQDHHGEAVRRVQRHGYFKYSHPPWATPLRWARGGPIRRILFNYLNRLRKKLFSTLIYFISYFNLLPTRSPRNRCDRATLTCPSSRESSLVPPLTCLRVFGWLLCKIVVRRPPKATISFIFFNFLSPQFPPQTT